MAYQVPHFASVTFAHSVGYIPPDGLAVDFAAFVPVDPTPSIVPAVVKSWRAPHGNGSRRQPRAVIPHRVGTVLDSTEPRSAWGRAAARSAGPLRAPWRPAATRAREVQIPAGDTDARAQVATVSPFRQRPKRDHAAVAEWDDSAVSIDHTRIVPSRHLALADRRDQALDASPVASWHEVARHATPYPDYIPAVYVTPAYDDCDFAHASGYVAGDTDFHHRPAPVRPIIPRDKGRELAHRPLGLDDALEVPFMLPWGPGRSNWRVDPRIKMPETHEMPSPIPLPPITSEVYHAMAAIDIVRLPERTPVLANEIRLSADLDSWAWGVQFSPARTEDLDLIRPSAGGPVEVEISVNGYLWTALIEGYSIDRAFGSSGYRVHGRSRTARLAAPYAAPRSLEQAAARTAQQLVDDELQGTGYTADYQAVDWLVPGGVWSYSDQTAMQAIVRIAAASGGVVQSDPALDIVRIVPRYADSPWDWAGLGAADVTIDHSHIETLAERWEPRPTYDSAWVIGQNQGVIVQAVRSGYGGTQPAPQVTEPLCVTNAIGRERGRTLIAASGDRSEVSLRIPLWNAIGYPGRVLPGDMVQLTGTGDDYKALATAVEISGSRANGLSVRQTVTLERYRGQ